MAGIESEILKTFLMQLESMEDVPAAVPVQLGNVLAAEKLPKPDQLVKLFAAESGKPLS
ncbi:hypothetical protein [Kocuria rosea]|uniref:hypothetical protein n=1 Tax=Kocuria rosea TaxID=1275 RepID=UPI00232D228B|nr:hypothetical protein [Kocuria rosea]